MTFQVAFLLGLLLVMVYLFLTEKLPIELTAFLGLILLVLGGYLGPEEAFSGFASPAVITMLAIFFVSAALQHTGVADALGGRIHSLVGDREVPLVLVIMLVAGALSAFMNNVAATAVLLPAVGSVARRAGLAASRLLMPLAFGAILGGTTTLVGTPPNLLAAVVLEERGLEPFGLFDFTPFGLALLGLGMIYMCTVGRRLLPERRTDEASRGPDLTRVYRLREHLFSVRIPPGSPLDGLRLGEARLGTALRAQVVAILRGGQKHLAPAPDDVLKGGDLLLVEGRFADLRELLRIQEVEVEEPSTAYLREASGRISGVVVRLNKDSTLDGRSLGELGFRERFQVVVAGIWRDGRLVRDQLARQHLRAGDELLVLGERAHVEEFASRREFQVLEVGPPAVQRLEESVFLVRVPKGSPLAGTTVAGTRMGELVGLTVLGIFRGGRALMVPSPQDAVTEGDQLLVAGEPDRILSLLELGDVEVEPRAPEAELESEEVGVVEAVVAPRSGVAGKSLAGLRFRERYGLQVLAIWREGEPRWTGLQEMVLRFGDALLLQGPRERIQALAGDPDFVVLSQEDQTPRRTRRAPVALGALGVMVLLVVSGLHPIQVAAFAAAVLVVLGGAITMEEAYRAIEWRAVFLVAAILPVGIAMERTGTALLLAEAVTGAAAGAAGPYGVLAAMVVLSSLLSQGLDGAPTVVLMAPVVLHAAGQLEISPYPLMMAVGLAASAAFMTPFSHKANLLVMGAGGYRAVDYIRVGTPLTLVVLALLVATVPLLFPFSAG